MQNEADRFSQQNVRISIFNAGNANVAELSNLYAGVAIEL